MACRPHAAYVDWFHIASGKNIDKFACFIQLPGNVSTMYIQTLLFFLMNLKNDIWLPKMLSLFIGNYECINIKPSCLNYKTRT